MYRTLMILHEVLYRTIAIQENYVADRGGVYQGPLRGVQ